MSNYDTSYLIDQIKRRASMPTSQSLFTEDKFVLMLNDELKTRIIPLLMSMREEWYVTETDYTGDGTTTSYLIPSDAVGSKLRNITIWNNGKMVRDVPRLDPDSLNDAYFGFYVKNNRIIIYPEPITTGYTLRLSYFKRSPDLVKTSEAGFITQVNSNDVTLSLTPPATFINGANVQIISYQSPFEVKLETTISNVVGSVITLASATGVSQGDWLCLSGQSVFPQLPIELIPCLCQAVVIKCLEALGDTEGMNSAIGNYQQMEQSAKATLSPKIDGAPKKILNSRKLARFLV